jgi:hypothetical protein
VGVRASSEALVKNIATNCSLAEKRMTADDSTGT